MFSEQSIYITTTKIEDFNLQNNDSPKASDGFLTDEKYQGLTPYRSEIPKVRDKS